MTPNPLSVRDIASVREAVALLTDKGFSAAPVIDEAGRPVGVVSRADILVHDHEKNERASRVPEFYHKADLILDEEERSEREFRNAETERTEVRDIMTPVVFSVKPDSSARRVVEDMVALKVHRLFVVENDGTLIGVISSLDVRRRRLPE